MKTVYHFTNESGFRALASGAIWYPSTGIPYEIDRTLEDHLQLSVLLALDSFYREQFETRNYSSMHSVQFTDVHYGPGWYVTEAPPNSDNQTLIDDLWQGRTDCIEKTKYWLKITVSESRLLRIPDSLRPRVAYLPIYNGRGGDWNRPAGINNGPAFLVEAGSRSQRLCEPPDVKVLHAYYPPIEVVPPMIACFDGWSKLGPDKQSNILGFIGEDSGFPGVPFPEGELGLFIDRKQFFAMAQLAIRSIGTGMSDIKILTANGAHIDGVFNFDILGRLILSGGGVRAIVHCRHQMSPMRLEHVNELIERARDYNAAVVFALVTSTFALNALKRLIDARIAPVLFTASQNERRQTIGMAIIDGEVINYPGHDSWVPVFVEEANKFVKVRNREQVLRYLG